MIDLANKYFRTETDDQSEKLLRIAVTQGYHMPKGLMSLTKNRIFKFTGFPYMNVSFPNIIPVEDVIIDYTDVFDDEDKALKEILDRAARFCRAHGYSILRIYVDENGKLDLRNQMMTEPKQKALRMTLTTDVKDLVLQSYQQYFGGSLEKDRRSIL